MVDTETGKAAVAKDPCTSSPEWDSPAFSTRAHLESTAGLEEDWKHCIRPASQVRSREEACLVQLGCVVGMCSWLYCTVSWGWGGR